MAKKKGTLKDMVKAPRTIDIDGQLHMLAWITPAEGKTLKELGGAGKKGPMGIPAYPPQGAIGTTGKSSGPSFGGSGPSPHAGNDKEDKKSVNVADFIGSGDEDEDQGVAQDVALAYAKPEDERSWIERSLLNQYEKGKVTGVDLNPQGRIQGYTSLSSGFGLPGILAKIFGKEVESYTGIGQDPFGPKQTFHEGGERVTQQITAPVSVAPAEEEDTPLTQAMKDYYTMGVGTATKPAQLTDIISASESPVGSRYDKEKGLLYLADGTIIDVRTGKRVNEQSKIKPLRISGLEMFKPIKPIGA